VIYVDASVLLAQLFAEDRLPPSALWEQPLISSRLTEYEVWTRAHARKLATSHGEHVRLMLGRLAFLEMTPIVLARALDPFPLPVRTLDALHLTSLDFLRSQGQSVHLATYDDRLLKAARTLDLQIYEL